MKRKLAIFSILICSLSAYPQAGSGVYQILNLPMDVRSISLGGVNVSVYDGDLNLAYNNPALLSPLSHNMLTFNYANYLAGINVGSVGYSRAEGKNKENIWGIAVNYFDYGKIKGADEFDHSTGNFTGKDLALNLMYARVLPKGFTVGATLKPIYSAYERYSSAGLAFDLGADYHNDSLGLSAGLALKSIGFQFNAYDQVREKLPFNIIAGLSVKFRHAPIRLSFTFHNLQKWDLGYEFSNSAADKNKATGAKWYDMLFRHVIVGMEILPSKNFFLSAAFNWRRCAEMGIADLRTMAGLSFGAGLKISKVRVGFALTQFQRGTLTYHVTFSMNLSDFSDSGSKIKQPKQQPAPATTQPTDEQQKQQQIQAEQDRLEQEAQEEQELQKKVLENSNE